MTAQHFETIAAILRELPEDQMKVMALHFARQLRMRYPKFDNKRFFKRIFPPEVAAAMIVIAS